MKKNVLLLCLSPVNVKGKENLYSYTYQGEKYQIKGFMTNEAPAKSVIERLYKNNRKRLDEIVLICSDTTKDKIANLKNVDINSPEFDWMREKVMSSGKTMDQMTHVEYYMEIINQFAEEKDAMYRSTPIKYREIEIPDFTEAQEVAEAAVQAADQVMIDGNNVDLYIDFNGGQRYVAFMILSIANLMKIRRIDVKEIMTMNYDNKVDGVIPIQNMEGVFGCIDLVSGINEYINYGRIKGLKSYFGHCEDEKIKSILKSMETFAKYLQLCRTEYVFENKEQLKLKLHDYLDYADSNPKKDTYEVLFSYVVRDILDGYRSLFEGDIAEIIGWCVDRDFIQQALTFYAERVPVYLYDSGIFCPTKAEGKEYKRFLAEGKKENGDPEINKVYVKDYAKYNEKYSWMIKYLQFSNRYKQSYRSFTATLMGVRRNYAGLNKLQVQGQRIAMANQAQRKKAEQDAKKLISYIKPGRAKTKISNSELYQILVEYYLLKEQRNITNHASDDKELGQAWTYDEICKLLRVAADKLRSVR